MGAPALASAPPSGYLSRTQKVPRNVVFLIGPGNKAWSKRQGKRWAKNIRPLRGRSLIIGDGEREIPEDEICIALEKAAVSGTKTTILVMAHGQEVSRQESITDGSSFAFYTGANDVMTSRQFFDRTQGAFGDRPVDIVFTACRGGASFSDMEGRLAKGSKVGAFTGPSTDLRVAHSLWFFDTLAAQWRHDMSADRLIDAFISSAFVWPLESDPALGIVGQGIEIPALALSRLVAQKPKARDILSIKKQLELYRGSFPSAMKALCAASSVSDIRKDQKADALLAARAVDKSLYSLRTYKRHARQVALAAKLV